MNPSTSYSPLEPFTLRRAHALAKAAELVYEPADHVVRTVRENWGYDDCCFLDVDDTQLFCAVASDTIVVSFRGTENRLTDWLTDADFSLVDGPLDGKVHSGFYTALSNVWQLLQQQLQIHDPHQRKALWVTGHSLGGALATLATARWLEAGRTVHGVYTFGQPRTGDTTFCRNFNFAMRATMFRFVNDNDLISELPPAAVGFSHLGTLKYFTDAGTLKKNATWWDVLIDRLKFRIAPLFQGRFEGTEDHSMIAYRKLIEAALATAEPRGTDEPANVLFCRELQKAPWQIPRRRAA